MIYIVLLIVILLAASVYLWKFYKKRPKQKVPPQKDDDLGDKIGQLKKSISDLETGLLEYAGSLDKLTRRLGQDESAWLQKQEPDKGPIEFPYSSESKGNVHDSTELLLGSVIQGGMSSSFDEVMQEIQDRNPVKTADSPKSDQESVAKIREELSPELKQAWAQKMVDARKAKKLQRDGESKGSTNDA
jgi:hypothetical protein